jgi:uncharacterized protein (TIGR02301 family)
MLHRLLTAVCLLILAASPVAAQSVKHVPDKPPPPATDKPPPQLAAPFDGDLARLSEILGALQYLRTICGANEGEKWRDEMKALIDAEAPNGARRERFVASFNRGYQGFRQTYRTCTPSADFAIRRYLAEGAKIAREITGRYAN